MMGPIGIVDIVIQPLAYLAVLWVVGHPLAFLATRAPGLRALSGDLLAYGALALAFGVGSIPLLLSFLDALAVPLTTTVFWAAISVFFVANVLILAHKRRTIQAVICESLAALRSRERRTRVLLPLAFLLMVFALHLSPTLGLYVHPGDDPKLYTLIATRIVEEGGFPGDWGIYAEASWYNERTHLLIPGYAALVALLSALTTTQIHLVVTLSTVTLTALIALGVYFLARTLSLNRNQSLAAGLVFGVLISEPNVGWFGWGGHAELSSLLPLAVVVGILLFLTERNAWDLTAMGAAAVLTAGMLLLHPFTAFYLAAFLLPYLGYVFYRRRRVAPLLFPLGVPLLAVILLTHVLIIAVPAEAAISAEYSVENPGWTPTFGRNLDPILAVTSLLWRVSAVYGVGLVVMALLFSRWLAGKGVGKGLLLPMGLWIVALFLLHENNPNGLYTVPFPLWYRLDSNRTFGITSLPVSVLLGTALYTFATRYEGAFRTVHRAVRWPSRGALRALWSSDTAKVLTVLALLGIQMFQVGSILNYARAQSPITAADAEAFEWIATTPEDSRFLVSWADAGPWISPAVSRPVVIPFGVVTNYTFYDEYFRIDEILRTEPNSIDVLTFLNEQAVDYVYVGPREIYDRQSYNPQELKDSPFYREVYNRSGVHIFAYLGASVEIEWRSDFASQAWQLEPGNGIFRPVVTTEGLKLPSGEANESQASLDLLQEGLHLGTEVTWLEVHWRTQDNAAFTLEVGIDDARYSLINAVQSSDLAVHRFQISDLGSGTVDYLGLSSDGEGASLVSRILIYQATPRVSE